MNSYELKNGWFRHGWDDWKLLHAADNPATVDSVRSGLMTGKANPVGFPVVGDSYMLLARQYDYTSSDVGSTTLYTDTTYNVSAGDTIVCDIGYHVESVTGTPTFYMRLGTETNHRQYNLDYSVGIHKRTVAARISTDESEYIILFLYIDPGAGETLKINWASADNFRVYPNLDYLTHSDANDTTQVTAA